MGLKHRGILRIAYLWLGLDDPRLIRSRHFYLEQMGMLESLRENSRSYLRCWHEEKSQLLATGYGKADGIAQTGKGAVRRTAVDLNALCSDVCRKLVQISLIPDLKTNFYQAAGLSLFQDQVESIVFMPAAQITAAVFP